MLVCGILFADAIASNSSLGVASITWWIILGVLYMIPSGLIIGELSSVYPDQGGIYVWISEGIGPKWAALTSWLFFCCGLFIPVSSAIMCSDIAFNMFAPETNLTIRIGVAIAILWLMVGIATKPLSESRWLTNLAGVIKLCMFFLCLVAGIVYIVKGNALANGINVKTLTPSLDEGLKYLPVILYCCTGMELASASAADAKNPAEALPKVVGGIAVVAVVLNALASLGMLMVIPLSKLDVNTGLTDMMMKSFASPILYYVIGIAFLIALVAQVVTWMIGGNRGTAESAKCGDLPAILGKENAAGMPVGAFLISASLGTVIMIIYAAFSDSAAGLFFSLLSCGVIGSLLPYVFMLIAYQKLKKGPMKEHDGYMAPKGVLLSWICQILQVLTLVLMIYIPGSGWNPNVLTNAAGAIIMVGTGLLAVMHQSKKQAGKKVAQ